MGTDVVKADHEKGDPLEEHVHEVSPLRDKYVVEPTADEQEPPAQLREVESSHGATKLRFEANQRERVREIERRER